MENHCSNLVCLLCCKDSHSSFEFSKVNGFDQGLVLNTFFQQTGLENCSLSAIPFVLCANCLTFFSTANEWRRQAEGVEVEVRRIQMELLGMLRNLQAIMSSYAGSLTAIEAKIALTDEHFLKEHKTKDLDVESVLKFRQGVLKVAKDVQQWSGQLSAKVSPACNPTESSVILETLELKIEPDMHTTETLSSHQVSDTEDAFQNYASSPQQDQQEVESKDDLEYFAPKSISIPKTTRPTRRSARQVKYTEEDENIDDNYSEECIPVAKKRRKRTPRTCKNAGDATISCSICSVTVSSSDLLQQHLKSEHPHEIQPESYSSEKIKIGRKPRKATPLALVPPPKRKRIKHLPTPEADSDSEEDDDSNGVNSKGLTPEGAFMKRKNGIKNPNWYRKIFSEGVTGGIPQYKFFCATENCDFSARDHFYFEQHLREHQDSNPSQAKCLQCPQCPASFSLPQYYDYHMYCHQDFFHDRCDQCRKLLSPLENKAHLQQEHSIQKTFDCAMCSRVLSTRRSYIQHLKYHLGNKLKMPCDLCPIVFTKKSELLRHYHSEHKEIYERDERAENSDQSDTDSGTNLKRKRSTNRTPWKRSLPSWYTQSVLEARKQSSRFVCTTCPDVVLFNPPRFEMHLKFHERIMPEHSRNLYNCSQCPSTFGNPQYLEFHQLYHDGVFKSICDICRKPINAFLLNNHLQGDHGIDKVFNCGSCFNISSSREKYLRHILNYHGGGKEALISCDLCPQTFVCRKELVKHWSTEHSLTVADEAATDRRQKACKFYRKKRKEKNILCSDCGMAFGMECDLATHISRVHRNERPYMCSYCPKAFRTGSNLSGHIKELHLQIQYPCNLCPKKFKISTQLKYHIRTKHEGKGLPCDQCDLLFATNGSLQKHLKTHELRKSKYILPCPKCDRKFAEQQKLEQHMAKQHKEGKKESRCTICNKVFHKDWYLREHINSVHKKLRPHTCNICGKTCTQYNNLIAHKQRAHPEEFSKQRLTPASRWKKLKANQQEPEPCSSGTSTNTQIENEESNIFQDLETA